MTERVFALIIINLLILILLLRWWWKPVHHPSPPINSPVPTKTSPLLSSAPASAPASAPVSAPVSAPPFEYISATYGGKDVTKNIKINKSGKILNPFVCCETLGKTDGAKELSIYYKRNGKKYRVILQEKTKIEGSLP